MATYSRTQRRLQTAVTLQNAAAANANGASLALDGTEEDVLITVSSTGTPVGVLTPEHTIGGAVYGASMVALTSHLTALALITNAVNAITQYLYIPPAGATALRVRLSGFATGTFTVTATARCLS